MTTKPWKAALVGLLAFGALAAAAPAKSCYIIDARGQKHEGVELRLTSPAGDLELNVDGRARLPFKAGTYRAAMIPKPQEVAILEKASQEGQHDTVIKHAGALFDKFKFLGWGGPVAYLEGQAFLQTGKPQDALKAFSKGRQFPGEVGDDLTRGLVSALVDMKDTEQVLPMVNAMMASSRKQDAAFAFASRGRMLEHANKDKEAVLEYLKVLLFFEDSTAVSGVREEARGRAVALLKKMNDGRWKQIEALK